MPIRDQFKGLDMKDLIGAPLSNCSGANAALAKSTEEFTKSTSASQNCQCCKCCCCKQ